MAVFALNRVGNFVISGALVIAYRVRSRNPKLPEPSSRIILVGAAIVGELLSVLGLYLSLLAYRTGPFSNVSAVLATLPVWVLIGAIIMNRLQKAPVWALPESMTGASLVLTLISLAAIAVSVYLISLG
jgi:drug/metabolite transporter (DMT)-like permease